MTVTLRLTILTLIFAALGGFVLFVGVARETETTAAQPGRFVSSTQCAQCHLDAWKEWHGSHHQIAYVNPEVRALSDGFRNKACQACHLPRPVAVTGYARRTLHRSTFPEEGVSCLTCHLGKNGEVLGRRTVGDAPCRPQASPEFTSVSLCESCHNQHDTTNQWRATHFPTLGTDCNDCHMPTTLRPGGSTGRSHVFAASHDIDMLRRAVRMDTRIVAGELVVEVENVGAGHNFPTEERSRAADVMVRYDAAEWQRLHRFRLPYRSEPLPDTTLPHGETVTLKSRIPEGARRAQVRLWYRLTPFVEDGDPRSGILFEHSLDPREHDAPIAASTPPLPTPSAFRALPDPEQPPPMDTEALAAAGVVTTGTRDLPLLALQPMLPVLRQRAADQPESPDATQQEQLLDLLRTALVPGEASARLAARARRSLLEHDRVRWALERALMHPVPTVRSLAAFELGQLGEDPAVVPLVLRLRYEVDHPQVMIWVVDALAKLGNYAGLPELIPLMERPDTAEAAGQRALEICRNAGEDLGPSPSWSELGSRLDRLHAAWKRGPAPATDRETRARIARHLLELEAFQLRGVDDARFTLSRLGTAAVPQIRDALRATEPYLRTHALEVVRELGPAARAAAAEIIPLLGDPLTRADAARALGRIDAQDAAPHLLRSLDRADLELRAAAAGALGRLGAADAAPRLERLFQDPQQTLDVRVHAALSLALLRRDSPARGWLLDLQRRKGYHASTLEEFLDRIDQSW